MAEKTLITVETTVDAPVAHVWACWTEPEHITKWNAASDDWHSPASTVDLREGGRFTTRMEAKDGSMGFDFSGVYTKVVPSSLLEYAMDDQRTVSVAFAEQDGKTRVTETFVAETENSVEMQRAGWQSILDNFSKYAEAQRS